MNATDIITRTLSAMGCKPTTTHGNGYDLIKINVQTTQPRKETPDKTK